MQVKEISAQNLHEYFNIKKVKVEKVL